MSLYYIPIYHNSPNSIKTSPLHQSRPLVFTTFTHITCRLDEAMFSEDDDGDLDGDFSRRSTHSSSQSALKRYSGQDTDRTPHAEDDNSALLLFCDDLKQQLNTSEVFISFTNF